MKHLVMALALASFFGLASAHTVQDGQTETLSYQTTYKGKEYNKEALVYLPANFDQSKKYNEIYLVHGSTETPRDFFNDGRFARVIDQLAQSGQLKNSIAIFATYYPSRRFVKSDYYADRPLNKAFAKNEFKDLMKAVVKKYPTYAKSTSQSALEKSRAHRLFGGFSMGSITTWYAFQYDLPTVKYFLPVAGDAWNITSDGGASAPRKTAALLAKVVKKQDKSFKIMAGVGSADGTSASMDPQIRAMRKTSVFNKQNVQYYH